MSYARFGWGSDVYVFASTGGWVECCACPLHPQAWGSYELHGADEVVAHLQEHVAAGHEVPADLLDPATYPDNDFVPYVRPQREANDDD